MLRQLQGHPVTDGGKVRPPGGPVTQTAGNPREQLAGFREDAIDVGVLEGDAARNQAIACVLDERLREGSRPPEARERNRHA